MDEPDRLLTATQISLARRLFPLSRMVVYALQNIQAPAYYSWTHALSHRLSKKQCNAVIAATHEAKEILLKRGYTNPIKVIPLFASKKHFYPISNVQKKSLRNQYGIADGEIMMCYAGSLDSAKGVFQWIAALTLYPRLRLFIASQHKWPTDISLNNRHRYLGPLTGADLRQLLQAADYVILPSIGNANWKEQIGRILLEGILCGAIGLGTNIGPIPEILLDERATFDPESTISLDNLLSQLPWPDSEKIQMQQRQYVLSNYEAEVVGRATAQFLLQLEKA